MKFQSFSVLYSMVLAASMLSGAFAAPLPQAGGVVDVLDARAPPAKAPVKAAPVKAAAGAKPTPCTPAQLEARELELEERAPSPPPPQRPVTHLNAAGKVTLFHGTTTANGAVLARSGVDLSKTVALGDFNHRPEVPGGFYLSDSLMAAAQFACYGKPGPGPKPTKVDVVEYAWDGTRQKVFNFPGETQDWKDFQDYNNHPRIEINKKHPFFAKAQQIYQNVMISGPLNGPVDFDLTDSFQQYAVVNQAAATNNLKLAKRHQDILCKNIPKGNFLTNGLYEQGMKTNAKFESRVKKVQSLAYLVAGGSCAVQ